MYIHIQENSDVVKMKQSSYFPSMAVYQSRGQYDADGSGKQGVCQKISQRHPTLLADIFTGYGPMVCSKSFCNLGLHVHMYAYLISRNLLWLQYDEEQ